MSLINLFFLLPSKGEFLHGFDKNDQLKSQAIEVWKQLDSYSPILLGITAILGIGLAILYYTWFNNRPGRHYKVKFWLIGLVIAVVLSYVVTLFFEYTFIKTNLSSGLTSLYLRCAASNAIYCDFLYVITSGIWCNFLPTNAYRFLK